MFYCVVLPLEVMHESHGGPNMHDIDKYSSDM